MHVGGYSKDPEAHLDPDEGFDSDLEHEKVRLEGCNMLPVASAAPLLQHVKRKLKLFTHIVKVLLARFLCRAEARRTLDNQVTKLVAFDRYGYLDSAEFQLAR